jgi:hypothetical protein
MKLKWKPNRGHPIDRLFTAEFNGVDVAVYVSMYTSDRGNIYLRYKGHTASTNWEGDIKHAKALAESLAAWWQEQKPMSK